MMEELGNMIATDASAADVSDQIKDILYAKSAKKIDDLRPVAAGNLFGAEAEAEVEACRSQQERPGKGLT